MRTVLVLASLVSLALSSALPSKESNVKIVAVEDVVVHRQYQVLELFEAINQVNPQAGYYQIGKNYDIRAHIDKYQKKEVVEKFLRMYEKDFLPQYYVFSIFNQRMRVQAMALYDLFYYASDFETFYNSAAWARVHLNQGMFTYAFYLAAMHRIDSKDLVLPAIYEIWPEFYANAEVFSKMEYSKMRGLPFEEHPEFGIVEQGENYYYYSNYSDYNSYGLGEFKLAYLTEDIGWNMYYSYFHALMPFWKDGDSLFFGLLKERRGEVYYNFYQQLLARYYLERLSNGVGEIPRFSWYQPFKYGYRPYMISSFYPYVQRSNNYVMQNSENLDDLRFVRNYEDMFLSFLEKGKFKAYNQDVDFSNSKSINFVGNFWQANPDLYEKVGGRHYHSSYEMAARRILGAAPRSLESNNYRFVPSVLDFYQTSLRDPAFYQIYNKIISFVLQYKQYLKPYSQDVLHYIGVKVNNVEISKLVTFFEYHAFNASNAMIFQDQELNAHKKSYMIMQPRLNHEEFNINIKVKSEVQESASVKIFVGPKYDGNGFPISFQDNWMNFVQLDWFRYNFNKGENIINRKSSEFFHFKDDSLSIEQIYGLLREKKLPVDMVENYDNLPRRLMLPRGNANGFPLQFFVVVYPSEALPKELEEFSSYILDDKVLGYPLDRPVSEHFWQPNMYMQEAVVYHKGSEQPWSNDIQYHSNEVNKH